MIQNVHFQPLPVKDSRKSTKGGQHTGWKNKEDGQQQQQKWTIFPIIPNYFPGDCITNFVFFPKHNGQTQKRFQQGNKKAKFKFQVWNKQNESGFH